MDHHTPGPWAWFNEQEDTGNTYAKSLAPANYESGMDQILYHGADWPISSANARLIAAAPELLEACKCMLREMEALDGAYASTDVALWRDSVRDAIAKATA